ncbi:GPW/gp25 family protein [Pseudomonas pergaminensis]|uniref:GPW/gp25 family protein n=1 Tax=Pseudomonas pergaminensis TaxID=2853159 RepID=UPI0034D6DCE1
MNRETGAAISELDHISQGIADILTTRIGTRVMRREYGSLLPDLVDHPFNDATRLRVYAATVMALMRWEPRISLSRVQFLGVNLQGQSVLELEGSVVDSNEQLSLSVPLQMGGSV